MNDLMHIPKQGLREHEFSPDLLRLQESQPSPMPRLVLAAMSALFGSLGVWATFAHLDVIAVAQGRVIPADYLQIVQPAESGIVRELLVVEGDSVRRGDVLARMDARLTGADLKQQENDLALRMLQLRRIDAELSGKPLQSQPSDSVGLFAQVEAQFRARRQAYLDSLQAEQAVLAKARQDLAGAQELEAKLQRIVPIYREQELAFDKLTRDGFAGRMLHLEKQRDRIEKEQDLKAQQFTIESFRATVEQSARRTAQISSSYRQQLHNERVDAEAQAHRLRQEIEKLSHRHGLLDLRAPQDGVVKDLATHTLGSVVGPGTVVMTVVPKRDGMLCEVWVTHDDVGMLRPGQKVRVKLAAYPFQKYGLAEGVVKHISPDASDLPEASNREKKRDLGHMLPATGYRMLVSLAAPYLESGGVQHRISAGMQLTAEVHLGTRTVLEYLLSPLQKILHEAGRER